MEDSELASARFEKENKSMRILVKRKVNETISLTLKVKATAKDIFSSCVEIEKLIDGAVTKGINDETIQLNSEEAQAYAMKMAIEYCLTVIESDESLISPASMFLKYLSKKSELFSYILIGKLFTFSRLLSFSIEDSESLVKELTGLPSNVRTSVINKEKTIIRLFFHLLELGDSAKFGVKDIWRITAHVLNSPHRLLATTIVINIILEVCSTKMSKYYGRQWSKIIELIRSDLMVQLAKGNMENAAWRTAGEAVHISVLSNTIDGLH